MEEPAESLADEPSEPVAESDGTLATTDAGPDFAEEALVPADTDPGLPEARILVCTVLPGNLEPMRHGDHRN